MYTYSKSAELLERARQSLAGGVSSEFRKYNHPHAIFIRTQRAAAYMTWMAMNILILL